MRVIYIYMECTKATTNNQDIGLSVTVKSFLLISHEWLDGFTWSNLCWKVLIKLFSMIYGILHSNKYS